MIREHSKGKWSPRGFLCLEMCADLKVTPLTLPAPCWEAEPCSSCTHHMSK